MDDEVAEESAAADASAVLRAMLVMLPQDHATADSPALSHLLMYFFMSLLRGKHKAMILREFCLSCVILAGALYDKGGGLPRRVEQHGQAHQRKLGHFLRRVLYAGAGIMSNVLY